MGELRSNRTVDLGPGFLHRFSLVEFLGAGATATVFSAIDRELDRKVAVKFATGSTSTDTPGFLQEWRILSSLNHPNILSVLGAGITDGCAWIASELASGGSLQARLSLRGTLVIEEALRIALDVLSALRVAHLNGVVHRDIKPANVLFTASGRVKLADFGLAREYSDLDPWENETGSLFGTPLYMSPEQLAMEPAEVSSDLWAVGVVLYEMLQGRPPFQGRSVEELRTSQASGPEPLPLVVRDVWKVADRALKAKTRRWPIASEMAEAIAPIIRNRALELSDWRGVRYVPDIFDPLSGQRYPCLGVQVPSIRDV